MKRILMPLLLLVAFLLPVAAQAWWHGDWAYRTKIVLDTGRTGVPLTASLTAVPVAVRLHAGNFNFLDTRDDGADLRFVAGDDKTSLPFHIDIYDWVDEIGIIWVQVPKLGGAGAPGFIWMYYGNPHAAPAGDAKATYDPDQTLVYHFGTHQLAPLDSTGYANNAKSSTAAIVSAGYLDRAAHLESASRIVVPATDSLKQAEGAGFTFSAWLKPDAPKPGAAPATSTQVIFSRQDGTRSFSIGLQDGQVTARVAAADGSVLTTPTGARLPAGDWHHLAVTVSDQATIYVDGVEASSVAGRMPALNSDIVIGAPNGDPATGGFVGLIDEVQISRVARPPAWIRLAALGQGPDSKLVSPESGEQAGAGGSEYLAILSMLAGSVTIDGWVVIGLITLLGLVTAEVIVDKAMLLRRTARANNDFLAAFHDPKADLLALDADDAAEPREDGAW
jgi:biopolymer transport protein ExbB